ncbi:tRNA (adenosine(37)-N6)-threonylcarbamoyltransferase complex ATPase subunit type 1 TsaE [Salipaludibacillus aurantiacus]|uniref:tRNA threonylcarbamoyladenosine biosynthesis protein TsaE n=1 Tax=Salipaludibacillus aurantiacus TaxID=1601833 RepID=A0A1H9U1V9_9BACI|nr:tRNA (adenosine(37)-N6)-threonylcarbamoyltransferase complex ATPase subunit type 1 TsaE [Salipaludibacillus aurantiacus]SES03465.1 tRNA threonylcarbamoyladenosine biosynthesis protein TsaE [Salipaludibacillus aurantiacus]
MKQEWTITTHSPEETAHIAEKLGKLLEKEDIITLEGDLGAGKTTFTKALAAALGVTRTVNSPTFTLMKEYEGRVPFYHMDAYRIEDEFEDLGLEEYFEGEGVTVVEWPSMIAEQLPEQRMNIKIKFCGGNVREFRFTACGERYISLGKELFNA